MLDCGCLKQQNCSYAACLQMCGGAADVQGGAADVQGGADVWWCCCYLQFSLGLPLVNAELSERLLQRLSLRPVELSLLLQDFSHLLVVLQPDTCTHTHTHTINTGHREMITGHQRLIQWPQTS